MGHVIATTCGVWRLTRMPSDHFRWILEETCPSHTYPIRHKIKDYKMMQSFMISGSLTWGADPNKAPDRSGAKPFPEENAIVMVFEGHPLSGGTACLA
jgi:hypothetical protein